VSCENVGDGRSGYLTNPCRPCRGQFASGWPSISVNILFGKTVDAALNIFSWFAQPEIQAMEWDTFGGYSRLRAPLSKIGFAASQPTHDLPRLMQS